ncbi:MAG: ATP-binding protein [Patescibacteria group bacterium]|jgi:hypothetical protein
MTQEPFLNPFRPGAGQPPPYLAGRDPEKQAFINLLQQEVIMKNMILTGLRGTGKTVLVDSFKPVALVNQWLWAGTDLSESASVSENTIATRILTDLSIITSQLKGQKDKMGFGGETDEVSLDYAALLEYYNGQPGLVSDKLRSTLEFVWNNVKKASPQVKGIVIAYDEAQKMSDQGKEGQYPLSVLLEVFQSLQKRGYPLLLVLVGLPTLQQRLVDARTYAERMFEVTELHGLSDTESREAVLKPIQRENCPVTFGDTSVGIIVKESGGYPYFIQFLCREAFNSFLSQMTQGRNDPSVPLEEIIAKLDIDFFAARWNNATDRERELLSVMSTLDNCQDEFTVKEVVEQWGRLLQSPISSSHASQIFAKLVIDGLIYRTRYGKYRLGIPLLDRFIKRQRILSAISE